MTYYLFALFLALTSLIWIGAVLALRFGLSRLNNFESSAQPTVSVIVAARNEETHIAKSVTALLNQNYPTELLEIAVVDDGSTDKTAEIVRSLQSEERKLFLIKAPTPGPGIAPKKNALLAGFAATTGDIILTTDADCEPGPDWVSEMVKLLAPGVVTVAGYSPVSGKIAGFDSFVNGIISAGTIGLGYPMTVAGRNFGYRRSAFKAVGGFGATIYGASGDDDLLLQKLAKAGGRVSFATSPSTFVPAQGPETVGAWLKMKRRHLSAGTRYSTRAVGLFSILYLFHAGLIASILTSFLGLIPWSLTAAVWGSKVIADFITLYRGARLLKHSDWLIAWVVAELASPLIVCIITPLSVFGKVKWKGRALNR